MRHPITRFTYFGISYDYCGDAYEIDDDLCVYTHGNKKLRTKSGGIGLCHRGVNTTFGMPRLYLAVTRPLPVEIEACSGINVIDHWLPETDARRYDWETPDDRKKLRRTRQARLDALEVDLWKPVQHDGNVFSNYEISIKTGVIRNVATKKIRRQAPISRQITLFCDDGVRMIFPHRVYMWTFESESRLPHQDQVDHINGDLTDDSPCNLRWTSQSENQLYRFKAKATVKKCPLYTGNFQNLKQFRDTSWFFGEINGDYAVVDPFKRLRRVGDFRTDARRPYPTIESGSRSYLVHRVVALVEGILSKEQFENYRDNEVVVMHVDNDKTNFHPQNLQLGTSSENATSRHKNPSTTRRKRVRQLDDNGSQVNEFESASAAAKAVGIRASNIFYAISKKHRRKDYRWELVDVI